MNKLTALKKEFKQQERHLRKLQGNLRKYQDKAECLETEVEECEDSLAMIEADIHDMEGVISA